MDTTDTASATIEALASRWPRALIAEDRAAPLAARWIESRNRAVAAGLPAFAHHPMTDAVADGLFQARRSRRLIRGLEAAEAALAADEAGLAKRAEAGGPATSNRISRLLVTSRDGSDRFFRQIDKVQVRFASRLAVLVLDCDEHALGTAAYGPGKRARAVLIDHKDAVIRFLLVLRWEPDSEDG